MAHLSKKITRELQKISINLFAWLKPGLGIKRWVLVVLIGTTLIALGLAVLVIDVYWETEITWVRSILNFISLSSLPRWLRSLIFGGSGLVFLFIGLLQLKQSILKPFLKPGQHFFETLSD